MARRLIIGEILNLIKGIGGNPSKFMGTKTNINFLGKGPQGTLFQGSVDMNALGNISKEMVISEAETAGGYATANKLNDLQLQRLKDNLLKIEKVYNPPANITDLATGTGDLTQQGLGSLREATRRFPKETHEFFGRPLKDADFAKIDQLVAEGKIPPAVTSIQERMKNIKKIDLSKYDDAALNALAEEGNRIKVQLDKPGISYEQFQKLSARKKEIDDILRAAQDVPPSGYDNFKADIAMGKQRGMSDELGAMAKGDVRRAGQELTGESGVRGDIFNDFAGVPNKFNPKNEIHVQKANALLKDPQIKGLYTEGEVKNAFDFEGLYQSHFDKGQVDVAQLFAQQGHNVAQMRSAARDALLQLMKKEGGAPGLETGLRDFVEQADFKFITEGGGGRAGDPINLMVKYFGKNATENLPKNATKENIDKFTDFIISARDSQGRRINDPFFERESIDFSGFVDNLPFATGGRVGYERGRVVRPGGYSGAIDRNIANLKTAWELETDPDKKAEIKILLDEQIEAKGGFADKMLSGDPVEKEEGSFWDFLPFVGKAQGGRVDSAGLGEILQVPRTGFKYGSRTIAKGALAFLKKNKKNSEYMFKASDNVSPGYAHGDTKYNAELLAEQLAEDAGVVYDDLDHVARSEFYGTAYDYLSNEMAQVLLQKRMLKDIGQKMQLSDFSPKGRKPNASGGLAKILEV